MLITASRFFHTRAGQIVALAARHRIYIRREFAEAGADRVSLLVLAAQPTDRGSGSRTPEHPTWQPHDLCRFDLLPRCAPVPRRGLPAERTRGQHRLDSVPHPKLSEDGREVVLQHIALLHLPSIIVSSIWRSDP